VLDEPWLRRSQRLLHRPSRTHLGNSRHKLHVLWMPDALHRDASVQPYRPPLGGGVENPAAMTSVSGGLSTSISSASLVIEPTRTTSFGRRAGRPRRAEATTGQARVPWLEGAASRSRARSGLLRTSHSRPHPPPRTGRWQRGLHSLLARPSIVIITPAFVALDSSVRVFSLRGPNVAITVLGRRAALP
jgi:hypothetical protein